MDVNEILNTPVDLDTHGPPKLPAGFAWEIDLALKLGTPGVIAHSNPVVTTQNHISSSDIVPVTPNDSTPS